MIMKKNLFFALLAALVLPVGFAACTNEDNPSEDPEAPESDVVVINAWDAPRYFQHAIATCEQNGDNFESFAWGVELYKNDPGHLYIGVNSFDEAEKMFKYWLAPNVKPALLPPSDRALQCPLPDLKGITQMEVYLKPGETDDVVAEVTVSDKSKLEHFYKITFLKNSAWPTNGDDGADGDDSEGNDGEGEEGEEGDDVVETSWNVGDIVKNVKITSDNSIEDKLDDSDKQLDFVCIRASGNGINPWFVATTKHDSYKCGNSSNRPTYNRIRKAYWVPDEDTSNEIRSMMKDNWDTIKAAWEKADNGSFPNQGNDKEPFIDRCHISSAVHFFDAYNFDSGYINGRKAQTGSSFFFNFNNYSASDVYDGCTVSRGARDSWSTDGGHSH